MARESLSMYAENVQESKMVWKSRVGNRKFLYGDFDKDEVKNVDDKFPFRKAPKRESHRVDSELLLSDELKALERLHKDSHSTFKSFKREENVDFGRVKHPISILRKLRLKYSDNLTDVIGTTIVCRDRREVLLTFNRLKRKYKVLGERNFYYNPKGGVYRAKHLIVEHKGKPVEIIIVSEPMARLKDRMHKDYKQGKDLRKYKAESERLYRLGY